MANKYLDYDRTTGDSIQRTAVITSRGSADAGQIIATDAEGLIDESLLREGETFMGTLGETIATAGIYLVESYYDTTNSEYRFRLADNTNGRIPEGWVRTTTANVAAGTSLRIFGENARVSGAPNNITATRLFLGTSGGWITTPLDDTDTSNADKISMYVGKYDNTTSIKFQFTHGSIYKLAGTSD